MARKQRRRNKNAVIGTSTVLALALVGGIFYIVTNEIPQQATTSVTEETAHQTIAEEQVVVDAPKAPVEKVLQQQSIEKQYEWSPSPEEPPTVTDPTKYNDYEIVVTAPTYINGIILANKQHPLPASYDPGVDPVAQKAVDEMIQAAKEQNIRLKAFSGYRSYAYQETLYTNYVARDGQQEADRYSARPGHSEHQTGLAFDIGEVGKEDLWLTDAFGETKAGKWLVDHAHEYGFILRYPKGKEHLTGYMYESWHFRYVGKDVAADIKNDDVTLEEYLGIVSKDTTSNADELQVGAKTESNR